MMVIYVALSACKDIEACDGSEDLLVRAVDDGLLLHAACVARCSHHREITAAFLLSERGAVRSVLDIARGVHWVSMNVRDDELLHLALLTLDGVARSLPDDATVSPAEAAAVVAELDQAKLKFHLSDSGRLEELRGRFVEIQLVGARTECDPPPACLRVGEVGAVDEDAWMLRAACRRVCVVPDGLRPVVGFEARGRLRNMGDVIREMDLAVETLREPRIQAAFIARVLRHRSLALCAEDPSALERASEGQAILDAIDSEVRAVHPQEFDAFDLELFLCERHAAYAGD
jgi:hypothetical protein